jgi:hypothetical protein
MIRRYRPIPSYHVCWTGVGGGVNVVKTRFRDDYQVETGGERLSNCVLQGFVSLESKCFDKHSVPEILKLSLNQSHNDSKNHCGRNPEHERSICCFQRS